MPRTNSTVEIKDGKVVFSEEVLNYFDNLRTIENSEWIDKYFKILNDENNLSSEKYRIHHIRPCFSFKDKNHKKRKETELLANAINGNKIKLSIENHIKAHYCLWKIYNNWYSKNAVQLLCKTENIEKLSVEKINEIAKFKEECDEHNVIKDKSEYRKNYRKSNNGNNCITKSEEKYRHSEKGRVTRKRYRESEHGKEIMKNYVNSDKGKENIKKAQRKYSSSEHGKETKRKYNHSERGIQIKKKYACSERGKATNKRYYMSEKGKATNRKAVNKYYNKPCYDPIEEKPCKLGTLKYRKNYGKNKELYKNINLKDCIIK